MAQMKIRAEFFMHFEIGSVSCEGQISGH